MNIGIIGVGFMGYTHFSAAAALSGHRVSAIATRSERKRAGDWSGIKGNFGPPAGEIDLSDVKTYADHRDLLADPDVDLVDICLPTHLHEEVTIEALAAGKAVLVEKPIALTVEAADRMIAAAEKHGQPLMVGHVLPFFPEFRYVSETIRSGRFGPLLAAHFRRVMTPPEWLTDADAFRGAGGWGIDLHIHDNHFICHLAGRPDGVFARGRLREDLVEHVHSQYLYPGKTAPAISCVGGGIAAKGLEFGHGFEIYLREATLVFDAGTYGGEWVVNRPLTVLTDDGAAEQPEFPAGEWYSAFSEELQTAITGAEQKKAPAVLSAELARDALKLCEAEAKSIREGGVVNW